MKNKRVSPGWTIVALGLITASYGVRSDTLPDQHQQCPHWADQGECATNPQYMQGNCATSCEQVLADHKRTEHLADKRRTEKVVTAAATAATGGWSWERILRSRERIVANGNVWPPPPNETAHDCLILVTHNQLMWHCPFGDEASYERAILVRKEITGSRDGGDAFGRYRGAFLAPGTDQRRLWLLYSRAEWDEMIELDTVTGEIVQELIIEDTQDGHDVVRVGDSAFMVDTRNGHIVEFAIPASTPPYTESSIAAGAKMTEYEEYVDILKRHTGFTRADHINNVAVHAQLLITNLHGKGAIAKSAIQNANMQDIASPTRLSALLRSLPEELGRELDPPTDGFHPVEEVGTWCHNIAFWEDTGTGTGTTTAQIKLLSLDSKHGSLVSVVLVGPQQGQREVLWVPDETHPVLVPPQNVARTYGNGAKIFSKGMAVQGGVAYFGVSYAREPELRHKVPESLLVAVDLATGTELWVRVIRSNGLISHILTQSYLGAKIQLPHEIPTIELTLHHQAGTMIDTCQDTVRDDRDKFCFRFYKERGTFCRLPAAKRNCCKCKGGKWETTSLAVGTLDIEIGNLPEQVTATATFLPSAQCVEQDGGAKRLSLEWKEEQALHRMTSVEEDLDKIVKHLCQLDVTALQEKVGQWGEIGFTTEYQLQNGNAVLGSSKRDRTTPEEVEAIVLVHTSKDMDIIYHFPWLQQMLPMLQETVLEPLGIPLNHILRMQMVQIPPGTQRTERQEEHAWEGRSHRVYVPLRTHAEAFFLSALATGPILRIRPDAGDVYELNTAMRQVVRNKGPTHVHLLIDWLETPASHADSLTVLTAGMVCHHPLGVNPLSCVVPPSEGGEEL